jgi:uncharacterized repeat protein (TIGR01451 family)
VSADSPGPQTPAPNPAMTESCGADVVLVLDASGSISSAHAVDDVRDAADAFLDALADTGSTARVTQFGSVSEQLAPQAEVTSTSLGAGGAFRDAINGYYDPIPPRPSGVTIRQYDGGGDPQSSGNWRESNGSNQFTNWDQSLDQAGEPQSRPIELVVYVTDGDPTAFDFNQPGDPFDAGPPPDVGVQTNSGSAAQTTMDRAIQEANQIKASGARMLAVGVGSAVTGNSSSRNRLIQIAGPQTVDDDGLDDVDSINEVDVALVRDFDTLAAFLRGVVNQLCTPSMAIRKLAQTPGDSDYTPAAAWAINVQPTVAGGGTYTWILPDSDAAQRAACGNPTDPNDQGPRRCLTNTTGIASFQWEPNPSDANTSAVVTEELQPGYTAGRPGGLTDWSCTLKNNDGTEETQSGEFGTPALGFTLDVDPNQIITCVVYNSFDYDPEIALTKVDSPTQVRGDLAPPANTVTSTFTVTNPGNTPLSDVTVNDNRCRPIYQSGDTDDDGLLAENNGETWIFTCTRNLTTTAGRSAVEVTNIATATGIDPTGERVTATDDATVSVYAPAITLTKTASPTEIQVAPGGFPVTYTYVATNTGNMTLNGVSVTDTAGPTSTCSPALPAAVTLAPGAQATFTCTTTLIADDPADTFVNTAIVSGNPVFPNGDPAPPQVTAQASAIVTAFQPGIELTKQANHDVVLPGTAVTYTYDVTNTGTIDLERTGVSPPAPANPRDGWVVDTIGPTGTCGPTTYVGGDADDDNVLDAPPAAETWTYTCTTTLGAALPTVRNTAQVVAQPVGGGSTLTALAPEVVQVVQPQIVLEKSSSRPTVLDPGAPAALGPDVPLRTPMVYRYTVSNAGNVAVRNVVVADVFPVRTAPAPLNCPVIPVNTTGAVNAGDADANGTLDPGEAWQYMCTLTSVAGGHALTKADADDPPGIDPLRPSPVTNTATATGEAFFLDGTVEVTQAVASNSASETVEVILPRIGLTKEPCLDDGTGALTCQNNMLVRPGTEITYRYRVTNEGDTNLRPINGGDDSCDVVDYVSGDTNDNGVIDAETDTNQAETWEYHCVDEADRPSPVTNLAGVFVVDPLGNTYFDTATAAVRIFEPAIELTKTVSDDLVPAGSTVTYTFEVANAGTVTDDGLPAEVVLSNIALLDVSSPANPACTTPTRISGDSNGNNLLDFTPSEVWIYQCTGVINETTVNAASVGARDIQGGIVADADTATVIPFITGIDITKVANPTQLPVGGGLVTYSYEVTNTGNVPLASVTGRVTDDKCPNVAPVVADGFNVGDLDHNELLTGNQDLFETGGFETWLFTCTVNVTVHTINTVTVVGTPVQPVPDATSATALLAQAIEVLAADVTDRATAEVFVQPTAPTTTTVDPGVQPPAPPGQLPGTGGSPYAVIYLGLLTIAIGFGVAAAGRRRMRTPTATPRQRSSGL